MGQVADDFKEFLHSELMGRLRKNSSYSMRSFARHLELEPSYLSKILSGKRKVTANLIDKLSKKFQLSDKQVSEFKKSVAASRLIPSKESYQQEYMQLSEDHFMIVHDWYHYAILELIHTKGFQADFDWLAKRLGISSVEVKGAVERLQRCGLLSITCQGVWEDKSEFCTTISNVGTSETLKTLQKQYLDKAIHAMNQVPIQRRDQSSVLFAFHPKNVQLAKEKIKHFRREMVELAMQSDAFEEVYALTIGLFPLTQTDEVNCNV